MVAVCVKNKLPATAASVFLQAKEKETVAIKRKCVHNVKSIKQELLHFYSVTLLVPVLYMHAVMLTGTVLVHFYKKQVDSCSGEQHRFLS